MVARLGKRNTHNDSVSVDSEGIIRGLCIRRMSSISNASKRARLFDGTSTDNSSTYTWTHTSSTSALAHNFQTNGGPVGSKRAMKTVCEASASMAVIIRFLRKVVESGMVKKFVAWDAFSSKAHPYATNTSTSAIVKLPPGFDFMMNPFESSAVRMTRRFILHSGILSNMQSLYTLSPNFASRILRSLDVCANPFNYGHGPCSEALKTTATLLSTYVIHARTLIMNGSVVDAAHRYNICNYLDDFNSAVLEWQRWKAQPMAQRVELVLYNLNEIETGLREEVYKNISSCVRKPFLQAEADRCNRQTQNVERQFMSTTSQFGGQDMLSKMKEGFKTFDAINSGANVIQDVKLIHDHVSKRNPSVPNLSKRTIKSTREMKRILFQERSCNNVSMEGAHHESVLDSGFHFKFPHMQRNDSCFDTMRSLVAAGFATNMRQQLQGTTNNAPVYRNALLAVKYVCQHLQELQLVHIKHKILSVLDDKKLHLSMCDGSLSWPQAIQVFRTIIYAMRFCVGSDAARVILYERRLRVRTTATPRIEGSCSKQARPFSTRPMAYKRLLEDVKKTRRSSESTVGVKKDTSVPPREDNFNYALDEDTYNNLMLMVQNIEHADSTMSTHQLGEVFCDTILFIMAEINKLDVSLANANIASTHMSTIEHNIEKEKTLVEPWFQAGLGVRNTLKWLRLQATTGVGASGANTSLGGDISIIRLVYRGYVSLLMDPMAQKIDEAHYPELLLLDIEYIQKARGLFYGYVAQATVLVIIGQRLTEAGVSGSCIHACIGRIVLAPAFIILGKADTCRGDFSIFNPLISTLSKYVREVLPSEKRVGPLETILREVARETTTSGYPSSPVACSIAQKWTAATLHACQETTGGVCVVHPAFSSIEATRQAFSSDFVLPKAALHLARDFHFYTIDIVKRTGFNVAVHSERYRQLASIL